MKRQLDMSRVTTARPRVQATCGAAKMQLVYPTLNRLEGASFIFISFFFFPKQDHGDINLHMIAPSTQICIIKTTRYRIVKGIQCRSIMDSLYRDSFDLFIGIDPKVNPRNRGGHRTCEIRHDFPAAPGSTDNTGDFFFLRSWGWPGGTKKRIRKIDPKNFFLPCDTARFHFRLSVSGIFSLDN